MNYVLPNRDVPFLGITGRWKMDHFHMSSVETDRGITFSATKKVLAGEIQKCDGTTLITLNSRFEGYNCIYLLVRIIKLFIIFLLSCDQPFQ